LGFKSAEVLFEIVGKDEYSLRNIEVFLRPPEPVMQPDDFVLLKKSRAVPPKSQSGVLVVGVDSLLTQLSKCCRPAPPDPISGYVTRGKGGKHSQRRLPQLSVPSRQKWRASD
jgi:GTP pyrophosphokinase